MGTPVRDAPVESAAVRVDVAQQLRIGTAVPEGDQPEHAPLHPVVVGGGAIAGDHFHDTLTFGADPRHGSTFRCLCQCVPETGALCGGEVGNYPCGCDDRRGLGRQVGNEVTDVFDGVAAHQSQRSTPRFFECLARPGQSSGVGPYARQLPARLLRIVHVERCPVETDTGGDRWQESARSVVIR